MIAEVLAPIQPIETPRLRLVLPAAAHVPAMTGFYSSDRAAARGWQCLPHEAWRGFAAVIGHHVLRGFGPLVAESREDGQAIGLFGPWRPEGQPENEIKWAIWSAQNEGKGLAEEAMRAVLTHAIETLGWRTAVSYIRPDNTRSVALALRLGAKADGTWTTPRGTEVQIFRHDAGGIA